MIVNFAMMQRHTCDILLFGSMGDIGRTAQAGLAGHGLTVVSVDFPQNTFRDFSGYRRELLKTLERVRPTIIMPIGDALALAMLKEELPSPIVVPVDSSEKIEMLSSKVRTYELARGLGIRQPALRSAADLAAGRRVIYKRDTSFGGSGVHKPRSVEALDNLIAHENGTPYLIEEYIEGEDLSVDCVRIGDFFRAECYVSTERTYTQGPSVERLKTECPEAVSIASKLLNHLDYQGVCGLDFRRAADGELYFLECNPRFTGGLRTQIASGFDIPYIIYEKVSTFSTLTLTYGADLYTVRRSI